MPMKNPMTPAGIEPATFRFVAKHLNHCATAVQCVGWTEEKSPNVILQYSCASEQIHKHTAKNKDYEIVH